MTDRVNALTVVLSDDMRDDEVQAVVAAILQLRAVLSVTPNVSDVLDHVAQKRAKHELRSKLFEVLS